MTIRARGSRKGLKNVTKRKKKKILLGSPRRGWAKNKRTLLKRQTPFTRASLRGAKKDC